MLKYLYYLRVISLSPVESMCLWDITSCLGTKNTPEVPANPDNIGDTVDASRPKDVGDTVDAARPKDTSGTVDDGGRVGAARPEELNGDRVVVARPKDGGDRVDFASPKDGAGTVAVAMPKVAGDRVDAKRPEEVGETEDAAVNARPVLGSSSSGGKGTEESRSFALCLSQSSGTGRHSGSLYSRPNLSPVSLSER